MANVLALGAENRTSFTVMADDKMYVSELLEELTDFENFSAFEKSIQRYMQKNNIIPEYIACDLHPDYRSTFLAEKLKRQYESANLIRVQHHFAHIVSCMLDNDLDRDVIGVSFDGVGYGADEKAWGGEFLVCNRGSFRRKYHFKYVALPGGDIAAKEPWRMALAYLATLDTQHARHMEDIIAQRIGNKVSGVLQMIDKEINCPLTSSAGRLFDAVSCIAGICDVSQFQAQAAILLEKAIKQNNGCYEYEINEEDIDVSKMIEQILKDKKNNLDAGSISAKFHNTLGNVIFEVSNRLARETGIDKVVVSGGCFQNKYLTNYIEEKFAGSNLELYTHKKYSCTDAGVSVGQAVVAASM